MRKLSVITLTLLLACDADDKQSLPKSLAELGCKLTQVNYTHQIDTYEEEYTRDFTHDSEGNLTGMEEAHHSQGTMYDRSLPFVYSDGKPTSAEDEFTGSGLIEQGYEFGYEGDQLSTLRIFSKFQPEVYFEWHLIYANGQIEKVESWSNGYLDEGTGLVAPGAPYQFEVHQFEFEDGNVKTIIRTQVNPDTGDAIYTRTTNVTYDDRINPYKANLMWLVLESDWTLYLSRSNPTFFSQVHKDLASGAESSVSWTVVYEYNDDALPIISKWRWSGQNSGLYIMGYGCE